MSRIAQIFNKDLEELTINDIKSHFSLNKEESDIIEYKSFYVKNQTNYGHKENAILKTICAFLNSSGGILIWGAPIEKKDSEGNKFYAGDLSPIDRKIDKDNFISKIVNRILPTASGIRIKIIETGTNNDCVVIFEVPESNYKPHRFDGRYWMRLDGQSKVAPHHFVESLFKQIKYPNIEGYLKIENIDLKPISHGFGFKQNYRYFFLSIRIFIFNFSPLINEEKLSFRLISNPGKFGNYKSPAYTLSYNMDGHEYRNFNAKEIFYYGEPLTETQTIILDPVDIPKQNNEGELFFIFGGRKSPQKKSTYKLNLNALNSFDSSKIFTSFEENITNHEVVNKIGKTKEEHLKKILGR